MDELCIYAKPPVPGRTKSRLARDIGAAAAAKLAKAMLQDTLQAALDVPDAHVSLWYPPNSAPVEFDDLTVQPQDYYCQHGSDLGERMADSFRRVLDAGIPRMLLLGSDCVTHSTASLRRALGRLTEVDVVLEPADDGGYILVGQAKLCTPMFDRIPWGTAAVMSHTRKRLDAAGVRWEELPETFDIDRATDLPMLWKYCHRNPRPHVQAWLDSHPDLVDR